MNFAHSTDHTVKIKENEKRAKYLELTRELKQLWIIKVTVIPIVTGELGTIPKSLARGLEQLEIGGRMETIQTTVLLKLARIL